MVARHLDLVLAVELQEVRPGVGELDRRFGRIAGRGVAARVAARLRVGRVEIVYDAVEGVFEAAEHGAGQPSQQGTKERARECRDQRRRQEMFHRHQQWRLRGATDAIGYGGKNNTHVHTRTNTRNSLRVRRP